jgi:hypothetical protein
MIDLTGLMGRWRNDDFSGDAPAGLNGERGRVRELCDLGDKTPPDGATTTPFRETVRVALVLAAAAVFARFFGLAKSGADPTVADAFSLSSSFAIWSLKTR